MQLKCLIKRCKIQQNYKANYVEANHIIEKTGIIEKVQKEYRHVS